MMRSLGGFREGDGHLSAGIPTNLELQVRARHNKKSGEQLTWLEPHLCTDAWYRDWTDDGTIVRLFAQCNVHHLCDE